MKIKTLLTLLSFGLCTATYAQTYDVSSTFLLNSGFDKVIHYDESYAGNVNGSERTIDGWTKGTSDKCLVAGVFAIGTKATFADTVAVPSQGAAGETKGGLFVLVPDWATTANYSQTVTLAPGTYCLKMHIYNAGNTATGNSQLAWIPAKGSRKQSRTTNFPTGQWLTDSVTFTLTAATTGRIQLGSRVAKAEETGERPLFIVDDITLTRDHATDAADITLLKEALQSAIDEATKTLGDGSSDNADELQAAIDAAKAVADDADATAEAINEARCSLQQAVKIFSMIVTTDTRYARGATMAFGRMTTSGIDADDIEAQGFCYAIDKPLPTVDDSLSSRSLSNNGTIYVMEGLQPATKYYMRAYVKTKSGITRYGKAIKFYTIPKGQITYNIRSISDDGKRERITNATKGAVDYWNKLTEIKDQNFDVGNDDVPTADCSYGGYIRVGNNTSYQAVGTLLHEMLHGVGVIPWAETQWAKFDLRASTSNGAGFTTGSGDWLGDRVTEVLSFWDNGTNLRLHGDYQHMWPYGINGAFEDTHAETLYLGNGLICQALGEDGLEHNVSHFAEPYYALDQEDDTKFYIRNEGNMGGYLRETANGTNANYGKLEYASLTANEALDDDSAAWYVTFTPDNQFYQIRNVATGRYLTFSTTFTIKTVATPTDQQDFQLMKSRIDAIDGHSYRGYWVVRHAARNPYCLNLNGAGKLGAATFNIANKSTAQRWIFLPADSLDDFQTVTGIQSLPATTTEPTAAEATDNAAYNLQGQRVSDTYKGIVIKRGKKIIRR